MKASLETYSKTVIIENDLGLHARAAARIAKVAQQAKSKVWMTRNNEKVDAASMIDILTIACPKGSKVTLSIDDPSDMKTMNRIIALIKNGFGEKT